MAKLNYIDLFAGASGMSEGFVQAGINPIAHVEMDTNACQTIKTRSVYHFLKRNKRIKDYYEYLKGQLKQNELYNKVPDRILNATINEEISDKTIEPLFKQIHKLRNNKTVDIIIGGPPCQAYSLVGRHQMEIEKDPRNTLYIQYGRFLREFKPKAFVFENVPGLLSANKGKHFKNLKSYFEGLDYKVYFDTLDAADFGVLQSRKRVIIIGWYKDFNYGFPCLKKLPRNHKAKEILSDLPILSPGDALNVVNYAKDTSHYLESKKIRNGVDFTTQHICRSHNENDLKIYNLVIKKWNEEQIRVKYPDIPVHLRTHNNSTSFIDRFKVVDGEGLSHTIVAHIAKDGHYYIHPDIHQCRSISVREAARLQSFPDDFYFEGSRTAAFKQIGNAVPPLMSYAIAKEMKKLLCQKTK